MNKNEATTIHFVLFDETTGDPVVAGSPTTHHASDGTVAATTNSAAYVSNNIWELDLTAAETNHDEFWVTVVLAGAVTKELVFHPKDATGAALTAIPWNSAWDVEVQSECTDALNAYDPPTKAELDSAHAATDAMVTTVDAVVDGIQTDLSNGTDGLGAIKAGVDALPLQADIVTNGAIATSSGLVLQVNLTNTCTTNTDMRGTDGANTVVPDAAGTAAGLHATTDGLLGTIAGYIDTEITTIINNLNALIATVGTDGAGLTDLGGMSSGMQAEVLAQINAGLDAAIPELGVGQPTATPTVRTGLMLLYMALRNKLDVDTTGADVLELHNDAGTLITSKALSDDGSDYSEAKCS